MKSPPIQAMSSHVESVGLLFAEKRAARIRSTIDTFLASTFPRLTAEERIAILDDPRLHSIHDYLTIELPADKIGPKETP